MREIAESSAPPSEGQVAGVEHLIAPEQPPTNAGILEISAPGSEGEALAAVTFSDREDVINAINANYTVTYAGVTEESPHESTWIMIELTDSTGAPLGIVNLSELTEETTHDILDMLVIGSTPQAEFWRTVTVPDVLISGTDPNGEPFKPGEKRTLLARSALKEILQRATADEATIDLQLVEETHQTMLHNDAVKEVTDRLSHSDEPPMLAVESAKEFLKAYDRRVDVVGLRNAAIKENERYLASLPVVRCVDFSDGKANEIAVNHKRLDEIPEPPTTGVRWIDCSQVTEAELQLLKEKYSIPERFVSALTHDDDAAHYEEEGGFLFIGQHHLSHNGEEVVDEDVHFLLTDGLILSFSNRANDILAKSFERLKDGERHVPETAQDVYLEMLYDAIGNNKEAPKQAEAWITRTLDSVMRAPMIRRDALAEHTVTHSRMLHKMEKIFAGQEELLSVVDSFFSTEQRSRRSVSREKAITTSLEKTMRRIDALKDQLEKIMAVKTNANNRLLSRSVAALTIINFAGIASPWFNNQLAIPGTMMKALAIVSTVAMAGFAAWLHRDIIFRRAEKKISLPDSESNKQG